MKLIIAEKPTLAKKIATALNATYQKKGYYENENYIITSAYGHLLELADINFYLGEEKKWEDVALPFFPSEMLFVLPILKKNDNNEQKKNKKGIIDRYNLIENLIKSKRVQKIINAGDADREGQVIVDNIIFKVFEDNHIQKATLRLWLPDQSEETILKALDKMENNQNAIYRNEYNEGIARTYIDWLFGINMTRYVTLKGSALFRVGRVIVPTVKEIFDRDMKINSFISEQYLQIESNVDNVLLQIKERYSIDNKSVADDIALVLNQQQATVIKLEEKEVIKRAPKLFSLSSLQGALSSKYKLSFETSLAIIQKLYESDYLSYPRTNTEYISENEKEDIQAILKVLKSEKIAFKDSKTIFDNKKIESHSAITITKNIPSLDKLTEQEKIVYQTVYNRFISNFYKEKCIIKQVSAVLKIADYEFNLKGETMIQKGFSEIEEIAIKTPLPALHIGKILKVDFLVNEKTTSPPKKHTETSLSKFLKNPLKNYEDGELKENDDTKEYEDLLKGIEIGTEATRTGIVLNAINNKYISRKKDVFSIEEKGIDLINLLDLLTINLYVEKSVDVSIDLKDVYKGKINIDDCVKKAKNEIKLIFSLSDDIEIKDDFLKSGLIEEKKAIGVCPRCQKNIYEGRLNFYCETDKECGFVLWKKDNFWVNKGKTLSPTMAKGLLKGSIVVKGLKPRDTTKSPYSATVELKDTGKYINYKMSFD